MFNSKSFQVVCALNCLSLYFLVAPLSLFLFFCRPCILIAVLTREASRWRRKRITHMSCCWLHRPKSHRLARSLGPIKVIACFKYNREGGSNYMKNFFVYMLCVSVTPHSQQDFRRAGEELGSFSKILLLLHWCCLSTTNSEYIPNQQESLQTHGQPLVTTVCAIHEQTLFRCGWWMALHVIGLNGIKLGGHLNP